MARASLKPKINLGSNKIKVVVIGSSVVTCDNPRVQLVAMTSGLRDKKRR